ncbi:MAG: hypothetical protein MI741_24535 [Rhodospirillales bacterium]|nr:hypothetical protein [Rhodospirillales bacterium]
MLARLSLVIVAGALLAACQTTYSNQTQAILAVMGSAFTDTDVYTSPHYQYNRADGAFCQVYQVRQSNNYGQVRYGNATVCRRAASGWFLAGHSFNAWVNASAPVPTPSYPVQNPSYPVQNPSQPVQQPVIQNPAMPPAPAPGQPGQWVPVVQ